MLFLSVQKGSCHWALETKLCYSSPYSPTALSCRRALLAEVTFTALLHCVCAGYQDLSVPQSGARGTLSFSTTQRSHPLMVLGDHCILSALIV